MVVQWVAENWAMLWLYATLTVILRFIIAGKITVPKLKGRVARLVGEARTPTPPVHDVVCMCSTCVPEPLGDALEDRIRAAEVKAGLRQPDSPTRLVPPCRQPCDCARCQVELRRRARANLEAENGVIRCGPAVTKLINGHRWCQCRHCKRWFLPPGERLAVECPSGCDPVSAAVHDPQPEYPGQTQTKLCVGCGVRFAVEAPTDFCSVQCLIQWGQRNKNLRGDAGVIRESVGPYKIDYAGPGTYYFGESRP